MDEAAQYAAWYIWETMGESVIGGDFFER